MRKSVTFHVLCLIAAAVSVSHADENGLFSGVRTHIVFGSSGQTSDAAVSRSTSQSTLELATKITSTGQLARLLHEAGFDAQEEADSQIVSIKVTRGSWDFPVLVFLTDEGGQLVVDLLLSRVPNENAVPQDKWLALLQANRQHAPASFGFSAQQKRTELYQVLENTHISSRKLRAVIDRLATVAQDTEELWNFERIRTTVAAPASTPATAQSTPRLAGKWVSSRSAEEAFAIQFNTDGTFLLAYVNNGQQTRSTGTFTFVNQRLTLNGSDGFRLSGTVTLQQDSEFAFEPANASSGTGRLIFKRAS